MIRVINCGYNYIHRDGVRIDRPAGAGNYAFVFFRSHAEVVVGGRRLSAAKNSYVLFRPSTPHAYRHVEKPFVNDWFHCEGAEMEALLEELGFACDEPVKAAFPASLTRSIMELQHVNRLGGPLRDGIVDLDLRSLLLKLSNWQQLPPLPEKTERYYRQLLEIRNELYSSPQATYSVGQLAAKVNLSKSYFQHVYKELFGCSVSADMINGRLEHAKYLLDNSSLPIAAIAKMCGYENDTHFMRQFKKFVGETPSGYKKRS